MKRAALLVLALCLFAVVAGRGGEKGLDVPEAEKILKDAAERKGDVSRTLTVLWVHNGDNDAVVRAKDRDQLLLFKLVKQDKTWKIEAMETRTGVWLKLEAGSFAPKK